MNGFAALASGSFPIPPQTRDANYYAELQRFKSSIQHQWRFHALWLKRQHPSLIAEYRRANLQPDMPAWTARTTADIEKKQTELKRPVVMASAAAGGAKAAPAPAMLKGAVLAFKAAIKGMLSAVAGAVSSRATNPDEETEDEDSLMWGMKNSQNQRSQMNSGSSEDFRKSKNGRLVYEGYQL